MAVTQNFLRGSPLTGVQGNPLEPGLSIGDYTRQFILQAPFAWRWNRKTVSFDTLADGTQDYSKAVSDFGWAESASVNDKSGAATGIVQIENRLSLSEDGSKSMPRYVAPRLDDDAGNITFRVTPAPDAVYTVKVTYQAASPTFSNLSDTWNPLPDFLRNTYELGFRAFAYEYFDDQRFPFTFQMFLRMLASASEGLNESQRNTIVEQFMGIARQQSTTSTQLAKQSRSGY